MLWLAVIVFPVPLVLPAHQARSVLLAVVELQHFRGAFLPLHAVVCQGERGWGLLAWTVEVEVVVADLVVPPVHLLVEPDVDAHVAGVVVGLYVEGLGHRLCRRVELEHVRVAIATHHVLADIEVPLHAVVGPYLEVLDSEHHRVVSGLNLRVVPPCLALPAAVG